MQKLISTILNLLENNHSVVLLSILESTGSSPRSTDAFMIVQEDGTTLGTIGGGNVEYIATKKALTLFQSKASTIALFNLSNKDSSNLGMICGGSISVYFHYLDGVNEQARIIFSDLKKAYSNRRTTWMIRKLHGDDVVDMGLFFDDSLHFFSTHLDLGLDFKQFTSSHATFIKGEFSYFIEPIVTTHRVLIFGGGHISQKLVPIITTVGFTPIVVEELELFATKDLFPLAADIVLTKFNQITPTLSINSQDYIVILTRGHQGDYEVLKHALKTNATYIGCIGSQTKVAFTTKRLKTDGFHLQDISRIHSPIGIDIKAKTPEEIAISITGQLIQHRAER